MTSDAATGAREFDVVVFGTTGFVGELTARYLAEHAPAGTRIALAGRSEAKLLAVRERIGGPAAAWPVIVADVDSPASLDAMVARTRVVCTTVGPYLKYGESLVVAAATAGTDYVDLTGEVPFVRFSIDKAHDLAAASGARIVHSCGFDSIPSDLTVFALHRRAEADGTGDLLDTNLVVRSMSAGVSGGTVASALEMFDAASADPELRRALEDPYTLSPDRGAEPELGGQSDTRWHRGAEIAPELAGYWTGAFVMAGPNTRIVRRSNALLDYVYGRRFAYAEQMSCGRSVAAPVIAGLVTGVQAASAALGTRFFNKLPRTLVDKVVPKPGNGPSEAARENGHYTIETYTGTFGGARYRATIAQQGDPGYKATAVLLGESGLALALDRDKLSDLLGVLTPASAMGDALLTRLPAAGVRLDVERLA